VAGYVEWTAELQVGHHQVETSSGAVLLRQRLLEGCSGVTPALGLCELDPALEG
jgi:hypothetical protein